MIPFTYSRATTVTDAIRLGAATKAKYLGGGTNLVDLLRETIEQPASLVDVTSLSTSIEERADVAVAAAIELDGHTVTDVRLALGGVATKPWRAWTAEATLTGKPAATESFRAAADAELAGAKALRENGFKVELGKRTMIAVLNELAGVEA